MYRSKKKSFQLMVIVCSFCLYLLLLYYSVRVSRHVSSSDYLSLVELISRFFVFGLESFIYLAIGSVVWWYLRDHLMALLVFCYSTITMLVFISLTSWDDDFTFQALVPVATIGSIFFLVLIAMRFAVKNASSTTGLILAKNNVFLTLSLVVLCLLTVITCLSVALNIHSAFTSMFLLYFVICFVFILIITISTLIKLGPSRKKSQVSIFLFSMLASLMPCLWILVLIQFLRLPLYIIHAYYLATTLVLLPIGLGYSLLRYELLILDRYVRRAVGFVIGLHCLASATYVEILVISVLNSQIFSLLSVIIGSISLAILVPLLWWRAVVLTDRILFPEMVRYKRLILDSSLINEEELDIDAVASLILRTTIHVFGLLQVCLLVLDGTSACYQLRPAFSDIEEDDPRLALFTALQRRIAPLERGNTDWLDVRLPALQRLRNSRRPVLLREILFSQDELPHGLDRLMNMAAPLGVEDCLLVPLQVQERVIGILVLGERADGQSYAGADLELAQILTGHCSSPLENARLYVRDTQYATLLNSVYTIEDNANSTFKSIEDLAHTYAIAAADVIGAFVEIWLYDNKNNILSRSAQAGSGPRLQLRDCLSPTGENDWSSFFFSAQEPAGWEPEKLPSCLAHLDRAPSFSLAWLPLKKNHHQIGVLTLAYDRPHRFISPEVRALKLFASQGSTTFEDARVAGELRMAYERQKELDALKDQFIMIASHELRTPLTTIHGYIELLVEHRKVLPEEMQLEFLEKALVGCNDLVLMVGNLMDVNLVHVDAAKMYIRPVFLHSTIVHVLDVLSSSIQQKKHSVFADVDPKMIVLADEMRLQQIVMNLINNALKYSSPGTSIEITAREKDQQVYISVRDHGLGVPPEQQEHLFQRFVRLERDVNSPVHGTGLGLYICDQLVRVMGGNIHVESSGIPGEGSTFTFTLHSAFSDHKTDRNPIKLPVH